MMKQESDKPESDTTEFETTESDTTGSDQQETNKRNKSVLIFGIVIAVLCIVFVVSVCRFALILFDYRQGNEIYDRVSENVVITDTVPAAMADDDSTGSGDSLSGTDSSARAGSGDSTAKAVGVFPEISIDIDALLATNADFIGWLYYEEGNISYPVVKEPTSNYIYLTTAFDGSAHGAGTPFITLNASVNFDANNTFIYAHNMKNGSMFGSLKTVYNDLESMENPYFFLWTKDGERIMYRVVSMYVTTATDSMYNAATDADGQLRYIDDMLQLGSVEEYFPFTETELDAMEKGAHIVTLSTCDGRTGTADRLLVHGIEISREPYTTSD